MVRNLSISISESNYQDLKRIIGSRKIIKFINQTIEIELNKKKQELIADYKSIANNKKIQKRLEIWDETLNDAWKSNNTPQDKEYE